MWEKLVKFHDLSQNSKTFGHFFIVRDVSMTPVSCFPWEPLLITLNSSELLVGCQLLNMSAVINVSCGQNLSFSFCHLLTCQ